ncbi:MAG: hypothetical protein OEY55_14745, partial [Acidimicrobiia bacterium]|nr:hypothetical protein [Acidimicrobiia bacterium]
MSDRASWPVVVLLRETLANLRSHIYKTALVVILMVASFVGLVAAETMSTSQHIGDRDRLIAAGENVFVVAPPPPGSEPSLPTRICDRLDDLPQIIASGGIVRVGFRELSKAPGTPLYVAGGTGSIARVLDPTVESSSGALISSTAARQVGIVQGETEDVDGHTVVLRPFDPERRFSNGETLVLIPYSGPVVDECWFETTPAGSSTATEVGLAAFATINRSVGPLRSEDL